MSFKVDTLKGTTPYLTFEEGKSSTQKGALKKGDV